MRTALLLAALAVGCRATTAPELALLLAQDRDVPALVSATAGTTTITLVARDAAAQEAQLEHVLALGVKVVVVEPIGGGAHLVARAHDRGVRVIAYERELADDALDALVTFDAYRIGVLQAEAAITALRGTGRIALAVGADPFAREIARGYTHTLAPYIARGAVILTPVDGSPDAVLATDGPLARSAILVARPAFAASAGGDNTSLVCSGAQQLDVYLDRAKLAEATARLAHRLLAGEDLERDPTTTRFPGRRLAVELAPVSAFTRAGCDRRSGPVATTL